ncbi:Hypothetical_protein [Hexamita inflata]|uniref:Hypothetical_protein n=1 Tax=Hexamita inflata TaxID=28002 RepID=A0ABP1K3N6_9EUKA
MWQPLFHNWPTAETQCALFNVAVMKHLVVIFCTHRAEYTKHQFQPINSKKNISYYFRALGKTRNLRKSKARAGFAQRNLKLATRQPHLGKYTRPQTNQKSQGELQIQTLNIKLVRLVGVAIKCVFMACSPWVWTAGRDFQKIISLISARIPEIFINA